MTNLIALSNVQSERTLRSDSEFTEDPIFYYIPVGKIYYYLFNICKKVCVNQQIDSDIDVRELQRQIL